MPTDEALVHVIDDDDDVRRSLEFLLRTAGIDVAVHESATAFLDALPTIASGCVLTDVRMPHMTGIDLLRQLREGGMALPVIIMTGHADVPLAVEAMKNGALDFLEKPFDDEALIGSVRRALDHWEQTAHQEIEREEYHRRIETLSGREHEVFQGLVAGHPNKVIGFNLGISPRTVEIYRANVMTKLNAASLSELVRMAILAKYPGGTPPM